MMKKKSMIKILVAVMVMVLSFTTFVSCSDSQPKESKPDHVGTLILKVNPEFAVNYDLDGNVTSIEAKNKDAEAILKDYTDYKGKPSREVVKDLVALMNEAGYIDTEVEGEGQKITIYVEKDSQLPDVNFLVDVVSDVKGFFDDKQITGKVSVEGESNYGMSEYAVSDYGETNFKTVKTTVSSDVARYTDYANTDYDGYNTDYDANTDYDGKNTDYEDRIGTNTDYDGYNSDYGSNTDYDDVNTDYGYSDYGYSSNGDSSSGSSSNSNSSSSSGSSSSGSSAGNTNYTNYDSTDYGYSSNGGSSSGNSSSSSSSSSSGSSSSGSSAGNTNYTNYDSYTNYDDNYTNYDNNTNYDDNNSDYDDDDD